MVLNEDFSSSSILENSINNRNLLVNRLKIHWIKLEKSKLYLIQLMYDFNKGTEFCAINSQKSVTICLKKSDPAFFAYPR